MKIKNNTVVVRLLLCHLDLEVKTDLLRTKILHNINIWLHLGCNIYLCLILSLSQAGLSRNNAGN